MNKLNKQLLVGLFMTLAGMGTASYAASSIFHSQEEKPKEKQADPPAKPTTIREAMASVGDIALELKVIEKRMQSLEKSIAGIDASLRPVGVLTRPEGLSALAVEVGDMAYAQARALILLATGCAAGLIILFAALRRWSNHSSKA